MKVISLGACCEPTFVIKKFFPDQLRGPFDWLNPQSIDSIRKVIENDFTGFLNLKDGIIKEKVFSSYDIKLHHDISKDAFTRRIARFREYLKNDNILFILKTHIQPYAINTTNKYILTQENIKNITPLCEAIRKYKGNNNFCILVVNESKHYIERIVHNNIIIDWIVSENVPINCNYSIENGKYDKQWENIIMNAESHLLNYKVYDKAICLYGFNDNWNLTKHSYKNGMHYFIFFDKYQPITLTYIKGIYIITEKVPNIIGEYLDQNYDKKSLELKKERYDKHIRNFTDLYQNLNNIKYDNIEIYEFNQVYSSNIIILSSNIVKIDKKMFNLKHLPMQSRNILFSKLFNEKVCDLEYTNLSSMNIQENDIIIGIASMTNILKVNEMSIFNHNERISQLINGLKTLRNIYLNVKIIITENSDIDLALCK